MHEIFFQYFLGFCLGQQRPYCHNYTKFQLYPYILSVNGILYTLVCIIKEIVYTILYTVYSIIKNVIPALASSRFWEKKILGKYFLIPLKNVSVSQYWSMPGVIVILSTIIFQFTVLSMLCSSITKQTKVGKLQCSVGKCYNWNTKCNFSI